MSQSDISVRAVSFEIRVVSVGILAGLIFIGVAMIYYVATNCSEFFQETAFNQYYMAPNCMEFLQETTFHNLLYVALSGLALLVSLFFSVPFVNFLIQAIRNPQKMMAKIRGN